MTESNAEGEQWFWMRMTDGTIVVSTPPGSLAFKVTNETEGDRLADYLTQQAQRLEQAVEALEIIKARAARLVELNCDHKWGDVYFGIKTPEPDEVLVNYIWRCEYCQAIKYDHGETIIRGDLEPTTRREGVDKH